MAEIPSSRKYSSGGSRQAPPPPPATRSAPSPSTSSIQPTAPPRVATSPPKKESSGMPWLFALVGLILLAWWYVSKGDNLPFTPFPTKQVVRVVPSTYVNVRADPGVEYPILVEIAPSTSLWALGEAPDSNGDVWIAIEISNGGTAYVKGKLLVSGN